MKITKWALSAAIAATCIGTSAFAQAPIQNVNQDHSYFSQQSTPVTSGAADLNQYSAVIPAACACGDSPVSNCDSSFDNGTFDDSAFACDSNGCDGLGGTGGEPWTLFKKPVAGFTVGGWTNVGYHTANNAGLGLLTNGVPANFNNYADHVQLQQQWLYAEKVADGSNGLGFGGRVDYIYGTDGPDTQAFGIPNNSWDNSWDHGGAYGHAIPQLYGEVAYGKLSVKAGHFFTIIGNEVVAATGNFFYSRQFTFYNAEPFTHTGALTSYKLDDDTTIWNGYVTGWDSGFEDNGDAYIGGFSRKLSDRANLTYTDSWGRFNDKLIINGNHVAERGQIHSMIFSYAVNDKLTYINQNDYLYTQDAAGTSVRNTFGSIHYLLYNINEKVTLGSRSEWFNFSSGVQNVHNSDILNQTFGVNYRQNANLVFRPEVRWVWDKDTVGVNENGKSSQAFFGTDMVMTF